MKNKLIVMVGVLLISSRVNFCMQQPLPEPEDNWSGWSEPPAQNKLARHG